MANSTKISEYSTTAANNTSIDSIDIDENCAASGINNAIRSVLKHQADAFTQGTPIALDQTNNRVGIGTTSPADRLHVSNGDSGRSSFASNTDLIIEDNGNAALQFASPNTNVNAIYFSDPESNTAGVLQYSHSTNAMSFDTADATRMTIDSSGNVGIGAAPAAKLHVKTSAVNSSVDNVADEFVIENNGACGMTILSANNDSGFILFGDNDYNAPAGIRYEHANNAMNFRTNSGWDRMKLTSAGRLGVNNTAPLAKLQVSGEGQGTDTGTTVKVGTNNTGFGGNASVMGIHCGRAGNSTYRFLQMNSDHDAADTSTSDAEFIAYGNGNVNADGSFTGGGADYAEFFEWDDGNSSDEDRRGYSVVLVNNKVRKATSSDAASDIIGVVSSRPAVIGDGDIHRWKGKYLRDDFGADLMETYTVTRWTEERDDEENIEHNYPSDKIPSDLTVPSDATVDTQDSAGVTLTRRRLNPDYDDTQTYTPRSERQEWDTIGLMGKLRLRAGQPTGDRWIKMRDIATDDDGNVTIEEWLVR